MAPSSRLKLLDAALASIRERGFAATTVEDLCARAGVTKGAFFHHFKSKRDLGVAAAERWSEVTGSLFESAPYHDPPAPLDRVLAYVDFRASLLEGASADFTCLAGTLVQEVHQTHPEIRDACARSILGHAQTLERDLELAREARGITPDAWSAAGLARHIQAVLQGSFVLAKAQGSPAVARESVAHLRRYLELLFAAG